MPDYHRLQRQHIATPGTDPSQRKQQTPVNGPLSATTQVSQYQKGKTNLDFTEARDSEWQWHQLGICKSAPRFRQITTPAPHRTSFFTGRMLFLPPNQQHQSTEGNRQEKQTKEK